VRFAFAGTPEFAAWVLRGLVELNRTPVFVISQPDRPQGRGRRAASPPAALEAVRLGVEFIQTENINSPDILERLRASRVAALVVAAFGQILRRPLLDSVLCLNVHASLLPAYRGAAPVQRAIANGEQYTGVSIMRMSEGLDEGPWALQKTVSIDLHDDAGSVARALAVLGAAGMDQVLTGIMDNTITWTEQDGRVSYAPKLTRDDTLFDTHRSARSAHDRVRSLAPDLGARAVSGQLSFNVRRTWPWGEPGLSAPPVAVAHLAGSPGAVAIADTRLFVGCTSGLLEILALQPAGRNTMTAAEFLRGYGDRLTGRIEAPTDPSRGTDRPAEKQEDQEEGRE